MADESIAGVAVLTTKAAGVAGWGDSGSASLLLAVVSILSSPGFSCLQRRLCHLLQSAAASSQLSMLMLRTFMFHVIFDVLKMQ